MTREGMLTVLFFLFGWLFPVDAIGNGIARAGMEPPVKISWGDKPLSVLCYFCHNYGGVAHDISQYVYTLGSHQDVMAFLPKAPGGENDVGIDVTDLPYTSGRALECASCHNVHRSDGPQPFLQRGSGGDYTELCTTCHGGRRNPGLVGKANVFIGAGGRSYSTHPTNIPVVDLPGNGRTYFENVDPRLTVLAVSGGGWRLGGHLVDPASRDAATVPFSCQTCHTVHGSVWSPGEHYPGLLAIDNRGRPSALCEGCHSSPGGIAHRNVGDSSDHPMDGAAGRPFYPGIFAGPAGIPEQWQGKRFVDTGATPFDPAAHEAPACTSCHDVHGGLPGTSLLRGPNTVDGGRGDWCFNCHPMGGFFAGNHPVIEGQDGTQLQECGNCHGGEGTAGKSWRAHGGFWNIRIRGSVQAKEGAGP